MYDFITITVLRIRVPPPIEMRRQVRPPPPCIACAAVASALASALAAILTATLLPPPPFTPPSPSPASAYPRGRPSSLWLASGYHQGAGLRMREHCARAARQRTEQSAAASSNTEKAKWPLDEFSIHVRCTCQSITRVRSSHAPTPSQFDHPHASPTPNTILKDG